MLSPYSQKLICWKKPFLFLQPYMEGFIRSDPDAEFFEHFLNHFAIDHNEFEKCQQLIPLLSK